jgi:hypothetical protein
LQDAATTFTQQLDELEARYAVRTQMLKTLDEVFLPRIAADRPWHNPPSQAACGDKAAQRGDDGEPFCKAKEFPY